MAIVAIVTAAERWGGSMASLDAVGVEVDGGLVEDGVDVLGLGK